MTKDEEKTLTHMLEICKYIVLKNHEGRLSFNIQLADTLKDDEVEEVNKSYETIEEILSRKIKNLQKLLDKDVPLTTLSKSEAVTFLAKKEKEATLYNYLRKYHPEYTGSMGEIYSFKLANDFDLWNRP